MKRIVLWAGVAGMAAFGAGCGKISPAHQERSPPPAHVSKAEANDESIEHDVQAIELQAQQAKHEIDKIAAEAEDARKRSMANIKADAAQQAKAARENAAAAAEAAAEAAEDAKDRAEDLPEAYERAVEHTSKRLRDQLREAEEEVSR